MNLTSPDTEPPEVLIFKADRIQSSIGQFVEALACIGGEIVGTGNEADLRKAFPAARIEILPGAVVVPGFNDAHCHPALVGFQDAYVDVSPRSVESNIALLEKMSRAVDGGEVGSWIMGRGYDPEPMIEASRLTKADLDRISPENPVVVMHMSAHWGVLNSAALRISGISESSSDPPGGRYGRDASGRLDGSLWERAFFEFAYDAIGLDQTVLPAPSMDDWIRGLDRVQSQYLAAGFTSVTDALVGPSELGAYRQMDVDGRLDLRVNLLVTHETHEVVSQGAFDLQDSRLLRFGGVKIFIDGAISGGTCALANPPPGHDGMRLMTDADLENVVTDLHRSGHQIAAHANGDEAIDSFLRVLDGLGSGVTSRRHRIEHCSVVSVESAATMARLGVVAVPFGNYAAFHGKKLLRWYGPELVERMFAHRLMIDSGVHVAGSSDYPCGPFEFDRALESCVRRRAGNVAFGQSQAIEPEEVLDIYTYGSAYASFEEGFKGRLEPGYLADFVVLETDPFDPDSPSFPEVSVLETYIGGKKVWSG